MDGEVQILAKRQRDLVVAMHEAGHAVACVRLGVPFAHVSIDREGGGGTETKPVCRPQWAVELERYAERCRAQVVVAFAGPLAEALALRAGITVAVGFSSGRKDERDARYFVREMIEARGGIEVEIENLPRILVAELGQLHREAEALVEAEFAVIEKVARRLAEVGRLSCENVKGLVGS